VRPSSWHSPCTDMDPMHRHRKAVMRMTCSERHRQHLLACWSCCMEQEAAVVLLEDLEQRCQLEKEQRRMTGLCILQVISNRICVSYGACHWCLIVSLRETRYSYSSEGEGSLWPTSGSVP